MNWLLSIVIAVLSGALGLFSAGFIMSACVNWYRISNFEGGAGYAVVTTGIGGGVVGFIIGLLAAWIVAAGASPGFLKGLGWSWGVILSISAVSVVLCWVLADIPPKIKDQELTLEIELRLPAGETNSPASMPGESHLDFGSVINHRQRKSIPGKLNVREARLVDGRWVVPGSVYLFTMRGLRSLAITIGGKSGDGFMVPLPARPGRRFEQWSDWLPRRRSKHLPWPDTMMSYRFRVERIQPPPPEPDPKVIEAERFAALKQDAPLSDYLPFFRPDGPEDRVATIMKLAEERPAEVSELIRSPDERVREFALSLVPRLTKITPEITEAVLEEGREIAAGVRSFNEMPSGHPKFYDVQVALRTRFSYWHHAWWTIHQRTGIDGRPPVQEILDLALIRSKETSMDEIVINAQAHLDGIKPVLVATP